MAILTGYTKVFSGTTDTIDSTKTHPLGTRGLDEDGNEFIYLTGIACTIAGSWVVFDEDHVTTLPTNAVTSSPVGRIAIAMEVIEPTSTASAFGWYQIYGKNASAVANADVAVDKQLYLTANAGYVDDADGGFDLILGAISGVAGTSATSCAFTALINYPFINCAADN